MKGTEDRGACTRETKGKEKQDREDGEREKDASYCVTQDSEAGNRMATGGGGSGRDEQE